MMKYHCVTHEENLYTTALKTDNVMHIVTKAVYFMKYKGLNHHNSRSSIKVWMLVRGTLFAFLK